MIVCLTGMHRSGTSLFANYLIENKIDMGSELRGPGVGNIRGHFEDQNFLGFHKKILEKNRLDEYLPSKRIIFCKKDLSDANSLLLTKKKHSICGWKDPRSVLFLELWQNLEPQIKFIFLYRDALSVTKSLFIREKKRLLKNVFFPIRSWIIYNTFILKYVKKNNNYILINIDSFIKANNLYTAKISKFLNHEFTYDFNNIFEKKLYNKKINLRTSLYLHLNKIFFSHRTNNLYLQLNEYELLN